MKYFAKSAGWMMTAGLSALALLPSCSADDIFSDGDGIPVTVKVTVPAPGDTRTNLTEVGGDLKWEWSDGDKLLVTDKSGNNVGTLSLSSIDNAERTSATFEGTLLPTLPDGENTLNFTYLGTEAPESVGEATKTFSLASQDGQFGSLKTRDILTTTVTAVKSPKYVQIPDFFMSHHFSAGHFHLVFADENTEVSSVSISGTGVSNTSVLNFGNIGWTETAGSISITPAAKDFYVTLPPSKAIQLVFTAVTAEGKTFEGKIKENGTFELASGKYMRRKLSDTEYAGIPVTMTEAKSGEYPGYENEDPRNPLHKFAKTNLTRLEGETNTWAPNGDAGALYQWGRNYGFIDNGGIYANSQMIDGSPWSYDSEFSNFIDAMGKMTYSDGYGTLDYVVYCSNIYGQYNGMNLTCGTGMHYANTFLFDMPKLYTTLSDLQGCKYQYVMDPTPGTKIRGYGTYYFGMDELNNKADYWISNFGDGGSTWSARATACGYDKANPCPDGWRLPTLAEMRAIAPEAGLDVDKGYLSSALSGGKPELRQLGDVRYAIRWLYGSDAITIEAVVVDDTYTSASQLTSLFWDQNADKKVVRQFPFTGMIRPFIGACDTPFYRQVYICRPHHFGLADFGVWPLTVGYQDFLYGVVGPADKGNFNRGFGGYWVEDKGYAFKFATRDIASSLSYSCLLVENAEPVFGYAIRPVMTK